MHYLLNRRLAIRVCRIIRCIRWTPGRSASGCRIDDTEPLVDEQHLERDRRKWRELVGTRPVIEVDTDQVEGLLELADEVEGALPVHAVDLHRQLIDPLEQRVRRSQQRFEFGA